ncbi:hypothetical protein M9978_10875 [Sphingomonas sp. MG17]|uniref:Uncharacterized protein n=1 Tax=Sphingomonas tagetis TaxID=2949092 RepID=A0A9X2KPP5_9SPHN|nr:hypothetical protein [Sphingomonas tagetis]MCP3730933.1 hypothetical protein [Sphingomonas tagetis]
MKLLIALSLRWQLGDAEGFDASYLRALRAMPHLAETWVAWERAIVKV